MCEVARQCPFASEGYIQTFKQIVQVLQERHEFLRLEKERNPRVERFSVEFADLPGHDSQRSQSDTKRGCDQPGKESQEGDHKAGKEKNQCPELGIKVLPAASHSDGCHMQTRIGADSGRIEWNIDIHTVVVVNLRYEVQLDQSPAMTIRQFQVEKSRLWEARAEVREVEGAEGPGTLEYMFVVDPELEVLRLLNSFELRHVFVGEIELDSGYILLC